MIKQRLQRFLKRHIVDRIIWDQRFDPEIKLHQLALRNTIDW